MESVFLGKVRVGSEKQGGTLEASIVDRREGGSDGKAGKEELHKNQLIIGQEERKVTEGGPWVCHHCSASKP